MSCVYTHCFAPHAQGAALAPQVPGETLYGRHSLPSRVHLLSSLALWAQPRIGLQIQIQ